MKQMLTLAFCLLLVAGCTGIKTTVDYDETVDFSTFTTYVFYGWDARTTDALNDFDRRRIEASFEEEFAKRGLKRLDKGQGADLVVSLFLINEERTQKTATTTHRPSMNMYMGFGGYYGYGPGWAYGPGFGGYSTTQIQEMNYQVGTLVCSVYDAQKKQLIWESAASKTIDDNPQIRKKSIPYVVRSIVRKYPKK
ncbi:MULTISPECIES: DUF4136 domain-containing protein [unclassified Carboxylicivirga]|uniref:DUF4136 domain-containing protein n=1 Tax=Carboxylicivirga TaxID=1628153 RepID=UPI003D33C96B